MGSNDQMLTWNTHSKTILDGVKSVHITDKYTDVTLVAEGEFFPAHRVILGACSEYFEMLFSYADNPKPFIVLDQPSKFIRGLLDYIYEGEVQIPSEDMKQFFKVAQFLKVRGLYVTDDDDPLRLSHHVVPPIPPTPIDENAKFQENLRLSLAHVDYLGSKYRPKGIQSATIAPSSAATTTTISAIPTTVNFGVTNPFSLNVVTNQLFGGANARGQINAYHLKPIMDGKRSPPLRKTPPPPTKRKRTAQPTNESELASEQQPPQQKAKNAKTRSNPPSRVSPVNAFPASTPSNILNIPNIISTTTSNPITTILLTTAIPSTTTTTTSVLPITLFDKLESQGKLMGEKSSGGQQRIARTTSPTSFLLASSLTSSGAVCGGAGFADSTDSASREALNLMPQVKIEMDEDPDEQRQLDHVIDGVDQMEGDLHAKAEPEDSDNQRELLVDDDPAAGDEGGHEGRSSSSSSSQGTEGGSSGDANGSSVMVVEGQESQEGQVQLPPSPASTCSTTTTATLTTCLSSSTADTRPTTTTSFSSTVTPPTLVPSTLSSSTTPISSSSSIITTATTTTLSTTASLCTTSPPPSLLPSITDSTCTTTGASTTPLITVTGTSSTSRNNSNVDTIPNVKSTDSTSTITVDTLVEASTSITGSSVAGPTSISQESSIDDTVAQDTKCDDLPEALSVEESSSKGPISSHGLAHSPPSSPPSTMQVTTEVTITEVNSLSVSLTEAGGADKSAVPSTAMTSSNISTGESTCQNTSLGSSVYPSVTLRPVHSAKSDVVVKKASVFTQSPFCSPPSSSEDVTSKRRHVNLKGEHDLDLDQFILNECGGGEELKAEPEDNGDSHMNELSEDDAGQLDQHDGVDDPMSHPADDDNDPMDHHEEDDLMSHHEDGDDPISHLGDDDPMSHPEDGKVSMIEPSADDDSLNQPEDGEGCSSKEPEDYETEFEWSGDVKHEGEVVQETETYVIEDEGLSILGFNSSVTISRSIPVPLKSSEDFAQDVVFASGSASKKSRCNRSEQFQEDDQRVFDFDGSQPNYKSGEDSSNSGAGQTTHDDGSDDDIIEEYSNLNRKSDMPMELQNLDFRNMPSSQNGNMGFFKDSFSNVFYEGGGTSGTDLYKQQRHPRVAGPRSFPSSARAIANPLMPRVPHQSLQRQQQQQQHLHSQNKQQQHHREQAMLAYVRARAPKHGLAPIFVGPSPSSNMNDIYNDMLKYSIPRPGGEAPSSSGSSSQQQGSGKSFQCPLCNKTFEWASLLNTHLRIHTGEKPYCCPKCPYRSTQKGNVQRHIYSKHTQDAFKGNTRDGFGAGPSSGAAATAQTSSSIIHGRMPKSFIGNSMAKSADGPSQSDNDATN